MEEEFTLFRNIRAHKDRALFVALGYMATNNGRSYSDIASLLPAFEFTGVSVLMLDDIYDGTPSRMGEKTNHLTDGVGQTICRAKELEYLGFISFLEELEKRQDMPEERKKQAFREFLTKERDINYGQSRDIANEDKLLSMSLEDYLETIEFTTGRDIGRCFKIGAILGNGDKKLLEHLYLTGINIGIAGQIWDDVIDYFEEVNKHKACYSDILGSKARLPLLIALQNPDTRDKVLANLKRINPENRESIKDTRSLIFREENYQKIMDVFNRFYDNAKYGIEEISHPFVRVSLRDLLDMHKEEVEKVGNYK